MDSEINRSIFTQWIAGLLRAVKADTGYSIEDSSIILVPYTDMRLNDIHSCCGHNVHVANVIEPTLTVYGEFDWSTFKAIKNYMDSNPLELEND